MLNFIKKQKMKHLIVKYRLATCAWLLVAVALLGSCRDFLYVEPTNQLSINSYLDVKRLLGGHLRNYVEGSRYLSSAPNVLLAYEGNLITYFYSDDCNLEHYLDNWGGRNNRGDFNNSLEWKHPEIHETIWKTYFQAIGFYNIVLAELNKHRSAVEAENEQVAGEARVMRAFCFFRLLQLFSPYHDNRLGLPLNTDPDKVGTYDASRKSQTENYNFIISELEAVLAYTAQPIKGYSVFYNKTFIHGLLAQVYLYKGDSGAKAEGDYAKASQHAQAVLDAGISADLVKFAAQKGDDFEAIFTKPYAPIVFIYNDGNRLQDIVGNPYYGIPQFPSDDLYALYADNDRRKKLFFESDKSIYRYESDFPYSYFQYTLCSGAEMKLIVAEAEARQGHLSAAQNTLAQFAATRYTAYTAPDNEHLLQTILDERRREFCFEPYMRWLDIHRLEVPVTHRVPSKKGPAKVYRLEKGDFRYTFPLPKNAELKDNDIEQNPGWNNF